MFESTNKAKEDSAVRIQTVTSGDVKGHEDES
jgi:hypothetical protein